MLNIIDKKHYLFFCRKNISTLAVKNILLFTKCSPNYFSYFTKTSLPRGLARFFMDKCQQGDSNAFSSQKCRNNYVFILNNIDEIQIY